MSPRAEDDDRVSNFGYFLRFIMRKKRVRATQVATLLDWKASYVENLCYGTEEPPAEGEVERLIAALQCDRLEGDALRLFSTKKGGYIELRRQADELRADLFEKRGQLEEKIKEIEALRAEIERLKKGLGGNGRAGALAPVRGDETGAIPAADARSGEGSEALEVWEMLPSVDRKLVVWLARTGMIAKLREIFGTVRRAWEPKE